MKKKTWIIIWILLIVLWWVWTFFYIQKWNNHILNNFFSWKNVNKGKDFDLKWNIVINTKNIKPNWDNVNVDFELKWGFAYKNKWLDERVKIENMKIDTKVWEESDKFIIKWLDLIQIWPEKFGRIENIKVEWENTEKDNKKSKRILKHFENGNYLYVWEQVLYKEKDVEKLLKKAPLLKDLILSYMTTDPFEYLKQKKVLSKIKNIVLSEKTMQYILTADKKHLNAENICSLGEYMKLLKIIDKDKNIDRSVERNIKECKANINQINKMLLINFKKENWKNIYSFETIVWVKAIFIYKNSIINSFDLKFPANYGTVHIDKDGIDANISIEENGIKLTLNLENNNGNLKIIWSNQEVKKVDINIDFDNETIKWNWKIISNDELISFKAYFSEEKANLAFLNKNWKSVLNLIFKLDNENIKLFVTSNKKKLVNININSKWWIVFTDFWTRKDWLKSDIKFTKKDSKIEGSGYFNILSSMETIKINSDKFVLSKDNIVLNWNIDYFYQWYYQDTKLIIPYNIVYKDKKIDWNIELKENWQKMWKLLIKWDLSKKWYLNIELNQVNGSLWWLKSKFDLNKKWFLNIVVEGPWWELGSLNNSFDIEDENNFKLKSVLNVKFIMPMELVFNIDQKYKSNKLNFNFKLDKDKKNIITANVSWTIKNTSLSIEKPKKYTLVKDKNYQALFSLYSLPNFYAISHQDEYNKEIEKYFGILAQKKIYIIGIVWWSVLPILFVQVEKAKEKEELAYKLSILTATSSDFTDLKKIGVCDSTKARILYDPLVWIYGLDCDNISDANKAAIKKIKGIVETTCSANISGAGADFCYKVWY